MQTLSLLDSYEYDHQVPVFRPLGNRRNATKKSKSCWREIERIKEQRQLLRDVNEFNDSDALQVLAAAYL